MFQGEPNGDRCPKCKSTNVAEIVYGLVDLHYDDSLLYDGYQPDTTFRKKVDEGKIILGGCIVRHDSHKYFCNDCSYAWGHF
ncbi:MAG: hypothetical protein IKH26_00615 [Bacteroidaceae bacterium]|nr:hypothetical protein [Bacteroidaceae bacterium]